jgi:AraC-like DNA-binding protein
MFDQGDRRPFAVSAEAAFGPARTGREDAELAISMLGPAAAKLVPTATAMHFGRWLGWPDWLREGTSLTCSGPLPAKLSLADDLVIIANIIDQGHGFALVERMLFSPRPVMGTTGALSLLHAPNMGLALTSILRAMEAQNPFLDIRIEHTADETLVIFRPPWPMGPLFRFAAIAGLALVYRALESMEFNDLGAITLETGLTEVPEAQGLLEKFGCAVEPSAGRECLRFPKSWETRSNLHHDPMVWAMAQMRLAELENDVGDPDVVRAVRSFIVEMIEEQQRVPRIKQAAAHLGLSTRTIVRLLAKHGTSFHTLVDEERKARALMALADPAVALAEVALRLGFNDMSSFGRSVRQWFGDTPGNLRKAWSRKSVVPS